MAAAFDLRQLRYFVAVAETGSFRAASERLHLSQPPLSRQVAELERALGAQLLERSHAGVTMTAAGRVALARALSILHEAEQLAAVVGGHAGAGRPIRVGLSAAVPVAGRLAMAGAFKQGLPDEAFDVTVGYSRDLIPALKRGSLDYALIGLPGDVTGLVTREVSLSVPVAALPSSHALARRKRVSMMEVDLPLFWIPRSHNPAYHDHCLRYFRKAGYRPHMIEVEPGQTQTLERIALGEGWTMPNTASQEARVRGVAFRELVEGNDLAVRLVAAWREPDREERFARLAAISVRVLAKGARRPAATRR